jgi:hypothetical protein
MPENDDNSANGVSISEQTGFYSSSGKWIPHTAKLLLDKAAVLRQRSEKLGMMDDWYQLQKDVKIIAAGFTEQEKQLDKQDAVAKKEESRQVHIFRIGIYATSMAGGIGAFLLAAKAQKGMIVKGLSAIGGGLGSGVIANWIAGLLGYMPKSRAEYIDASAALDKQHMGAVSKLYDAYQEKLDTRASEIAEPAPETKMTRYAIPLADSKVEQLKIQQNTMYSGRQ